MKDNQPGSIKTHFSNIVDSRDLNKRHKLIDIITIAICAVVCGANSRGHIEVFGQSKIDWFKDFLQLPHGIPSHDTFGRVFDRIDPDESGIGKKTFKRTLWVFNARKCPTPIGIQRQRPRTFV
jgi:hypothetical protein